MEEKPAKPAKSTPASLAAPKSTRTKDIPSDLALAGIDPGKEVKPKVVRDLLFDLVSKVPLSTEGVSHDPLSRSQVIARNAAKLAASVSGSLALPPGPLGMATIIPDLVAIWRIQRKMVADIAAVYGKTDILTTEMMVFCLFKHGAAMLVRDLVVRAGGRLLVKRASLRTLQSALQKIGIRITQKVIAKSIAHYVPLVGALAIGGYAYYDTSRVAATAIDAFSRDIAIEEAPVKRKKGKGA
jgi:hypothetical protein